MLFLLLFSGNQIHTATDSYKAPELTIMVNNTTASPIIMHFIVPHKEKTLGNFGVLFNANESKTVTVPEFYWFDKVATGGLRKPGTASKVRLVDALKHSLAKQISIFAPNQPEQQLNITEDQYTITLTNEPDAPAISVQITADDKNAARVQHLPSRSK